MRCHVTHPFFFFYWSAPPRDLHSFPTRRSSDLCSFTPKRAGPSASRCWSASRAGALHVDQARDQLPRCARRQARQERSEEHTSELQSRRDLVCRLLLEKKKTHGPLATSVGCIQG